MYSKKILDLSGIEVREYNSENKMAGLLLKFIYLGNLDQKYKQIYREIFRNDTKSLSEQKEIYALPTFSEFILKRTSVNRLCKSRIENYKTLRKLIEHNKIVHPIGFITESIVPFTFPIYTNRRDDLKEYLSKKQIYCAIHWPLELRDQKDSDTLWINDHIMSISIDHRYSFEHMKRISEAITSFERIAI